VLVLEKSVIVKGEIRQAAASCEAARTRPAADFSLERGMVGGRRYII